MYIKKSKENSYEKLLEIWSVITASLWVNEKMNVPVPSSHLLLVAVEVALFP